MYIDDPFISLKFHVFEARLLAVPTGMTCVMFHTDSHACKVGLCLFRAAHQKQILLSFLSMAVALL